MYGGFANRHRLKSDSSPKRAQDHLSLAKCRVAIAVTISSGRWSSARAGHSASRRATPMWFSRERFESFPIYRGRVAWRRHDVEAVASMKVE